MSRRRHLLSKCRLAAFLLPVLGAQAVGTLASANAQIVKLPLSAPSAGGEFVDGIAAIVDKDVITLRELQRRSERVRAELARQEIQAPDNEILQRQVLQRVIQERIEDHEAARLNIRVDDEQIEQAIQTIAQRNKLSSEQMRQHVETSTSWDEYRHTLERDILRDRLRQRAIDHTIVVTDFEVEAFLKEQDAQRDLSTAAGQPADTGAAAGALTLAQILVRVPEGSSPEQVATLRRKADDLRARVARGEDFATLAAASSDGSEALEGGMMGTRPAAGWPDLFLNAVAEHGTGDVTEVIQSGNGFHILKVVARQGAPAAGTTSAASANPLDASLTPMPITQTQARHILIKTSAVMSDEQARQRLTQLRQRVVQGGEDFADLARRFSADASAPQGGALGWLTPGETVPAFETAMNALQEGQVSEPIQSPFGWHLIKVEARRTQDMADEFQRMQARQALFERRSQFAFENWLEQLRDQTYIDNRLEKRVQLEQDL